MLIEVKSLSLPLSPWEVLGVSTRGQHCKAAALERKKLRNRVVSRKVRLEGWAARPLVATRMDAAELVQGSPTPGDEGAWPGWSYLMFGGWGGNGPQGHHAGSRAMFSKMHPTCHSSQQPALSSSILRCVLGMREKLLKTFAKHCRDIDQR